MTVWYNFSSFSLYGYPAIVRGWHYGWNPTGDTLFPKQISATKSVPCSFSYSSGGSNVAGDFAYDMFLRWDNQKSTPQLEVMVWAGNDSWPIGTQTGTNVISEGSSALICGRATILRRGITFTRLSRMEPPVRGASQRAVASMST